MKSWINFDELRKQLSFGEVLASYGVQMTRKGDTEQYVGECPLPSHGEGKGETFSANYERKIWQCFRCKQSGNILDFAVLMAGKNKENGKDVRAVAMALHERFVKKADAPPAPKKPNEAKAPERKPDAPESTVVINQPLDFQLKTLDAGHAWFAEQKLSPETVAKFGLGFCSRGSLSGRIAVPLQNDGAELVGYAGLATDLRAVCEGNPRYLFPTPREHDGVKHVFDRRKLLYNGSNIGRSVKDLVVVRDCHTVWHLFQGGFANVVALMGDECSDEQAVMLSLLTEENARIWLLTDSSLESEECARHLLPQTALIRLTRWLRVKTEAEIVPDHPLLRVLPRR